MKNILTMATILLYLCIATGLEDFSNKDLIESSDAEDDNFYSRERRAGFNMLRLGRGLQMLRLGKRREPILRLGRSVGDTMSDEDVQYILSLMRNSRQVSLPRHAKDLALQYILTNAVQNGDFENDDPRLGFGYDLGMASDRQIRPAPRPGRYRRSVDTPPDNSEKEHNTDEEKQQQKDDRDALDEYNGEHEAPQIKYGKNSEQDEDQKDKRAMNMLRMGRGMRMLRLGKRPNDDDMSDANKRALQLLRLGKRPFRMLRLGRGDNEEDIEEDKRALKLLRMGKKSEYDESR